MLAGGGILWMAKSQGYGDLQGARTRAHTTHLEPMAARHLCGIHDVFTAGPADAVVVAIAGLLMLY